MFKLVIISSAVVVVALGQHHSGNFGGHGGLPALLGPAVRPVVHSGIRPVKSNPYKPVGPRDHGKPVVHRPVGYRDGPVYKDEVARPYAYEYGVHDEYTGTHFNAQESGDGKTVTGSYQVHLPDGRIQTVTYTADHYNGFVADVQYEGTPKYPDPKDLGPAPYAPPRPALKPGHIVSRPVDVKPVVPPHFKPVPAVHRARQPDIVVANPTPSVARRLPNIHKPVVAVPHRPVVVPKQPIFHSSGAPSYG